MPPIRRYLRISRHSVLECRIFLENPADGPRWLLSPTDPALPRVFEAVRPLVLPKLREENDRAKGKGKKKKSVKDVVVKDDFETKEARDKDVDVKSNTRADPVVLREDSDEATDLARIPEADAGLDDAEPADQEIQDDKKQLGFKTSYNGFAIWGKVLCLLVERKGAPGKRSAGGADGGAQALMQEWITASQMQQDDDG
ncbi:hypothetical protein LTR70_006211 [Exophiala xenobiotica]|uniref:Uncharacterized protein n=1 Tax=Lithohypha guttulata TaxID=1690604 RepID=A0ABR0K4A9_9EURO|nr:hypothetical protein LTR24_007337 [Lithohypha guttulata]KAK5316552.1 hypothetical protein LTR70_006211 [Exophiala xenobiotica]